MADVAAAFGLVVVSAVAGALVMWVAIGRAASDLRADLEHMRRDAASWRELAERTLARVPEEANPMMADILKRLIDVALPAPREPVAEDKPGSPAEYDPPLPEVGDWTDPFFGLERSLVGGLAPGQAIPGIGEQADDEPMVTFAHGDEPLSDYEPPAHSDAWFEAWDAARTEGPNGG